MKHTSVFHLLRVCCPSTIRRFVISIIVDAIQRMFLWPGPHVREKVFKLQPAVTYDNSSTAVMSPFFDIGICASLNHARPTLVSPGMLLANGVSVGFLRFADKLGLVTTARFCVSVFKKCIECRDFGATFANGITPSSESGGFLDQCRSICDYFKLSKFFTYERYFSRHNVNFGHVVFSDGRPATTGAHCAIVS